jgi:uncharacterized SAM-binding protein YcdF (DUF218 family)
MNQENTSTPTPAATNLPAIEQRRRGRWRAILCGLLILLCGMLIGAGTALQLVRFGAMRLVQEPERLPDLILTAMDRRLDLDPAQHAQIQTILAQYMAEFEAQRRETHPKIMALLDKLRADVGAVLRPDQAARWYDRFDTIRARWLPKFPANPPAPPPGSTPEEAK